MASGHDIFQAMYDQFRTSSTRSEQYVLDPGTGGTFNLRGKDRAYTSVGTGTYKLPDNVPVGVTFRIHATGTVTITSAAAVDVAFLASGQAVEVTPLSSTTWGVVSGGYADEYGLAAATTVNDALNELYNTVTVLGHVDLPLGSFRAVDADGDVANTAATPPGGLLTSNTTPILEASGTTNAWRLNFAAGDVTRIASSVTLPSDFNGAIAATVGFIVASAGTTNSWNTAVLVTNWDGGADVTGSLTDTATTAVKVAAGSVAAGSIPDSPLCVTVSLTPPTHAADALYIYGCRIRYTRTLGSV